MNYAGFWRRFLAYLFDILPITLLIGLVFYFHLGFDEILRKHFQSREDLEMHRLFLIYRNYIRDISLAVWIIYSMLMDASPLQGTLGKRMMGMRVVNEGGYRISFMQAFSRNTGKFLSALPLGLGFLWAGWSQTKQAWHDRVSHCFVVRT